MLTFELGRAAAHALRATRPSDGANTMLGNINASLEGTYCTICTKHIVGYLGKLEWRLTNRFDLATMIRTLGGETRALFVAPVG